MRTLILVLVTVVLTACSNSEPQPIAYGTDECAHCMMKISDPLYGAEMVTSKGKAYKFDAIECLAAFVNEGTVVASTDVAGLYVTNLTKPEMFIPAEKAMYVRSTAIKSPMGMGLAAVSSEEEAKRVEMNYFGDILTWDKVKATVKTEGM
jgi:copper chaperone NosL